MIAIKKICIQDSSAPIILGVHAPSHKKHQGRGARTARDLAPDSVISDTCHRIQWQISYFQNSEKYWINHPARPLASLKADRAAVAACLRFSRRDKGMAPAATFTTDITTVPTLVPTWSLHSKHKVLCAKTQLAAHEAVLPTLLSSWEHRLPLQAAGNEHWVQDNMTPLNFSCTLSPASRQTFKSILWPLLCHLLL